MKCPYCNSPDTKVTDSRDTDDGTSIRRRRQCLTCGRRFTTYETVEENQIRVIKKDGSRELFDRTKIRNGIIRACEKRNITSAQIDDVVNRIEKKIRNGLDQEVSSETIGRMVMDELKDLDQVAYVRFASVYREFKDIGSFMSELEALMNSHKGKDMPSSGRKDFHEH
ncbi:transcriptional regulator NrdR [uncultured Dialister sp.]|uniref:transcriptional regulator NrdR n=1 Tax=uncultured Dialister sp. TaxID=278064 RepID=UPI0025F59515|nr:transcriptional regulator NrdR [uncultured Dialister sp.]